MARRSGFPSRRARSSGVARDWGVGPGSTAVTTITASGSTLLGNALTTVAQELTVLRTRGILDLFVDGVPGADGDGFFGAVGIGKATLAAFTAGIGSLPTPISEAEWDGWLWHQYISIHVPDITGEGGNSSAQHQRIQIDSKGMRKFDTSEVLFAAVEVVETGAASMSVRLDTRMLLQDSGR